MAMECLREMLRKIEQFLEYILRNAYILVAMKGTPMISSGKKAVILIKDNLIDVIALNKLGDFVMAMARLFVAVMTAILCYTLVPVSLIQFNIYI